MEYLLNGIRGILLLGVTPAPVVAAMACASR